MEYSTAELIGILQVDMVYKKYCCKTMFLLIHVIQIYTKEKTMSAMKSVVNYISYTLFLSALLCSLTVVAAEKKSNNDVAAFVAQELKLDEQQTKQMSAAMDKFGAQLEKLFAEQEGKDADPEKLIAGVKQAQDAHNKELQNILSKDQYKAYEALKEKAIKGIFTDLAEIQLMEIQPKTSLSNEQVTKLAPVLADSKYRLIKIAWENAGKNLRPRQKMQVGNQLKSVQRDARAGVEKVLTPEQLQAWDKYMAEQQQKKG